MGPVQEKLLGLLGQEEGMHPKGRKCRADDTAAVGSLAYSIISMLQLKSHL